MTSRTNPIVAAIIAVILVACTSCKQERPAYAPVSSAVETLTPELVISVGEQQKTMPLLRMDIFLSDGGQSTPETFKLHGKGVLLTGAMPAGVSVGYTSEWGNLQDQKLPISQAIGEGISEEKSSITIPGLPMQTVTGGTITITWIGQVDDSKVPMKGTLTVHTTGPNGNQTYQATFAVLATTWG